jgi:hypothetical protein
MVLNCEVHVSEQGPDGHDENQLQGAYDKVIENCLEVIDRCHRTLFNRTTQHSITDVRQLIAATKDAWGLITSQFVEVEPPDDDEDAFGGPPHPLK